VAEKRLVNVRAIKDCRAGERVSFRARALRFWEIGGLRMCLAGDESGLTRVEVGDSDVEAAASYEFRDAEVREYPGGWHSVSVAERGEVLRLAEDIPVPQSEAYIERTYKILAGVQRKKGRAAGRVQPWRHPAGRDESEEGKR
jgi:hypothetical protein